MSSFAGNLQSRTGTVSGIGPVPYQLREGEPRKPKIPTVSVSGALPNSAGSYHQATVVVVVVVVGGCVVAGGWVTTGSAVVVVFKGGCVVGGVVACPPTVCSDSRPGRVYIRTVATAAANTIAARISIQEKRRRNVRRRKPPVDGLSSSELLERTG